MRIGICILNYNMPEATDALVEAIQQRVKIHHELTVLDNGSDLVEMSKYTTMILGENVQTTGGWLAYLSRRRGEYDLVWLLITSTVLPPVGTCPLTPMVEFMKHNPNVVGVHPALTIDSTTSWEHLKSRGGDQPRQTWMIDNIAPLWRYEWLRDNPFDPELKYAWGIDLETCYLARRTGRTLWVHEGSRIKKITDIGYAMDRMNMSADERRAKAGANMRQVLHRKYGSGWWDAMTNRYVEEYMK